MADIELKQYISRLLNWHNSDDDRYKALTEIFLYYQAPLGWYLYYMLDGDEDAKKDVYINIFADVINNLSTIMSSPENVPTEEVFQGWLYKKAGQNAMDYILRRGILKSPLSPDEETDAAINCVPIKLSEEDNQKDRLGEKKRLGQILSRMSKKCRTIWLLQDILGISQYEIAKKFNCSEKTIKQIIIHARKQYFSINQKVA